MPEIMVRIRKTVDLRKKTPKLELTPVTFAAQQQIRDRRLTILRNGSAQKREFLRLAFDHARVDPRHAGDPEPLLVLSREQGDSLIWEVVDDANKRVTDFSVEVHVFVDPGVVSTPAVVPAVFAGFGSVKADNSGFVHSGSPTPAATTNDFGWHKFKVTTPDGLEIDPCIFV